MKVFGLLLIVLLVSQNCFSQIFEEEEEEQDTAEVVSLGSKLYYGGYVNLSFGTFTVVGLTPMVAYKVSPRFSVGTQLSYEYVKDKSYNLVYESSNYGLSIFSRYRFIPQLYSHIEFSQMRYKFFYSDGSSNWEWVPQLWIGGGYSQPISRNTWFTTQILFDVINNEKSPYYGWEPYFSVGFGVGF